MKVDGATRSGASLQRGKRKLGLSLKSHFKLPHLKQLMIPYTHVLIKTKANNTQISLKPFHMYTEYVCSKWQIMVDVFGFIYSTSSTSYFQYALSENFYVPCLKLCHFIDANI